MNASRRDCLVRHRWSVAATVLLGVGLLLLSGCPWSSEVGSINMAKSKAAAAEKGIAPGPAPDRTPPKRGRPDPKAPKYGEGKPAGKSESR